jgi:hypothetical protein
MIAYYEIDRLVRDGAQGFSIIDDVNIHDLLTLKLGIMFSQLVMVEAIDIANIDIEGQLDRMVKRADFDT